MQLEFMIHEQTIEAVPTNSIPRRGSKEYLSLLFRFREEWEKYTKTVYFQHGEYSEPIVIGESGVVEVPAYFTSQESFMLMLVGIDGGEACPTNVLCIALEDSGETWESVPPDTEIPAYQQLVALAQEAAEAAEAANKASVFVPLVSEDGTLSWKNDKGLENPTPVNIKGPKGDTGEQGPKGDTGEQGPQGDPGETQFDNASAEKLQRVASNFIGLSGAAMAGIPVSYPGKGILNAEILRTDEEVAANQEIKLVSFGKAKEMIRKDITEEYIPLPTAADAGKVLIASADGKAVWTAVMNAEEVAV